MADFAALPPEVNSARMYAGAGSSPMLSAAATWDRLAATLGSAAASYQEVVAELTDGSWQGPASAAMTTAAEPYVQWMNTTAGQATQLAGQARAAAAAYEAAFSATVPPAAVTANRAELQMLLSSNVIGQNTAAIAANQAEYVQMWAQDAAAMHGYAASSAAATQALTPFSPPPQTTNPAAAANQTAATASQTQSITDSALQSILQGIANAMPQGNNPLLDFFNSPLMSGLDQFNQLTSGYVGIVGGGQFMAAGITLGGPNWPVLGAISAMYQWTALNPWSVGLTSATSGGAMEGTLARGLPEAGVSAKWGEAASVGRLSTPASWVANAPNEIRAATASMSSLAGSAPMGGGIGAPMAGTPAFMPPMGGMANAARGGTAGSSAGAGGTRQDSEDGVSVPGAWTERDELNRMRVAVAHKEMQRDALKRSAAIVIRKVKERQRQHAEVID